MVGKLANLWFCGGGTGIWAVVVLGQHGELLADTGKVGLRGMNHV
jgi:hypothetical protein